nr:uncharacterized protein LOC129261180 [Lytechinus pictus]
MLQGGVTLSGLKTNIAVGILFIDSWLIGRGHFPHSGSVEDSATAEISRSQVWQWIRHGTCLEDSKRPVTRRLVIDLIQAFLADNKPTSSSDSHRRLRVSANIFLELVTRKDFPEFITTYMNSNISFRAANHLDFANLTPVSSNL